MGSQFSPLPRLQKQLARKGRKTFGLCHGPLVQEGRQHDRTAFDSLARGRTAALALRYNVVLVHVGLLVCRQICTNKIIA